jgi:hypothetical protein
MTLDPGRPQLIDMDIDMRNEESAAKLKAALHEMIEEARRKSSAAPAAESNGTPSHALKLAHSMLMSISIQQRGRHLDVTLTRARELADLSGMLSRAIKEARDSEAGDSNPTAESESLWTYAPKGSDRLVISRDGKRLVTVASLQIDFEGKAPRTFRVWDTATGNKVAQWTDAFAPDGLAITKDGTTLVSVGLSDGKPFARAWALATGRQLFSTTTEGFKTSRDLTLLADGSQGHVMTAGYGYYAIELKRGKITTLLTGGWGRPYVAPWSGLVVLPTLEEVQFLASPEAFARREKPNGKAPPFGSSEDEAVSDNGRYFAAIYSKNTERGRMQMIGLYDIARKKQLVEMECGLPPGKSYERVVISDDGRYAVIADPNWEGKDIAYLLDLKAKKAIKFDAMGGVATPEDFTPAGVLVCYDMGRYRYFDPATQAELRPPLAAKHFEPKR